MVDKLESCPFCGGEGDMSFYARTSGPEPAGHFVECISCAAAGPGFDIQGDAPDRVEYTKSKAAEAWNIRATPTTDARERIKVLEEAENVEEALQYLEGFPSDPREVEGRITALGSNRLDAAIRTLRTALDNKEPGHGG